MFEVWYVIDGLPRWLSGKESICQGRRCWRHRFSPSVGKISLWRRKRKSTPVSLPEKSHGQRSLVGYSPWCHKELDMSEHLNSSSLNSFDVYNIIIYNHIAKFLISFENSEKLSDICPYCITTISPSLGTQIMSLNSPVSRIFRICRMYMGLPKWHWW